MLDIRGKALHYGIDWDGSNETEGMEAIIDAGIDSQWFREYDADREEMVDTGYFTLFSLAWAHFIETGGLISQTTLAHQAKASLDELAASRDCDIDEALAEIKSAMAHAKGARGNASEAEKVVEAVRERYATSELEQILHGAANDIGEENSVAITQEITSQIDSMRSQTTNSTIYQPVRDVSPSRRDKYERVKSGEEDPPGIMTGFTEFDKRTLGTNPGRVCLVVGNTGLGKTKLREKILYNMWQDGHSVVEILSENSPGEAQERLEAFALTERIEISGDQPLTTHLREGTLTEAQEAAYFEVLDEFGAHGSDYLYVDPLAYERLSDLEGAIAKLKQQYNIQAVSIDDLHNQNVNSGMDAHHLQQGATIQWMRRIAKRYEVVVFGEVQEQQDTVTRRFVGPESLIKYSHQLPATADVIWRLFDNKEAFGQQSIYKEVQIVKDKINPDNYQFPIVMDDTRMLITNAPMGLLDDRGVPKKSWSNNEDEESADGSHGARSVL